jgi:hypothetical protein
MNADPVRPPSPRTEPPHIPDVEYRLQFGGLVENPIELDVSQLRALAHDEQITLQPCAGAWPAPLRWASISMTTIIGLIRPLRGADWAVISRCGYGHAADRRAGVYELGQLTGLTVLSGTGGDPGGVALLLADQDRPGARFITSLSAIDFVADVCRDRATACERCATGAPDRLAIRCFPGVDAGHTMGTSVPDPDGLHDQPSTLESRLDCGSPGESGATDDGSRRRTQRW